MTETDRSPASIEKLQERMNALKADLGVVSGELKAEQQMSAELNEEIDDLNRLRALDLQRAARDADQIERLTKTNDGLSARLRAADAIRERETSLLQQRHDAVIEEWGLRYRRTIRTHNREVSDLVQELTEAQKEVEVLRSELNSTAMLAPHDPILERMVQPESVVVVDGESLGRLAWPDLAIEVRREVVLGTLGTFGEERGVNFDVVFAETNGVQQVERFTRLRVRVPHGYVPIEAAMQGLATAYRESGPVMVGSDNMAGLEPYEALSLAQLAERLGLTVPPAQPALVAGTSARAEWETTLRYSPFDDDGQPAVTVAQRP